MPTVSFGTIKPERGGRIYFPVEGLELTRRNRQKLWRFFGSEFSNKSIVKFLIMAATLFLPFLAWGKVFLRLPTFSPDTSVRSGINKTWEEPFRMDEDDLRRIYFEFLKAGKELDEEIFIKFRVEKEDDRFYETTDIDEVLSDPNSASHYIDRIEIILTTIEKKDEEISDQQNKTSLSATFDADRSRFWMPISFIVSYNDKNWSLVFADAAEKQIQRVFREATPHVPKFYVLIFFASVSILAAQLIMKLINNYHSIKLRDYALSIYMFSLFLGFISGMFFPFGSKFLGELVEPKSVFLWGELAKEIAIKDAKINNLYYSIIIGMPLSILANLIPSYLLFIKKKAA